MLRRTFLQLLVALPGLALIRPKAARAQQPPPLERPDYADSDNNPPAVLAQLADRDTQSGGVIYQP